MMATKETEEQIEARMEAARNKLSQEVQDKFNKDGDVDERDRRLEAAGRLRRTEPVEKAAPAAKAKSGIVTKEELAKSGLSLRDYMNKQKGLTRRDGKAPAKAPSKAQSAESTKADFLASQRKRSDTIRDLTKAEREAPAGTSALAKQKIAEAKRKATEEYATAGKAEDAKQYKPRPTSGEPKQTTNKPVASSASADSSASTTAKAGRGVTRNPSPGFFEKIRARGEKDLAERGLKKGGSINGIAKRGLTNCKTV
jgi:hypothetical protein